MDQTRTWSDELDYQQQLNKKSEIEQLKQDLQAANNTIKEMKELLTDACYWKCCGRARDFSEPCYLCYN